MTTAPLRMGLAGTGYWADIAHASAVGDSASWQLSSVWGRDAAKASELAARHGATHAGDDFDAFLDQVDAVTFALPPMVQSELALRAMEAGKHVAMEKPIALTVDAAQLVVATAERTGVAGITMFTTLYDPRIRAIVADVEAGTRFIGGAGLWLGSALGDENPFNTPWRGVHGGLWDVGPHAISIFLKTIGGIRSAHGVRSEADLVHLVLGHDDGRTTTTSLTLNAPEAADGFATMLWGASGKVEVPVDDVDFRAAFVVAYDELAELIRSGSRAHPCDLAFGAEVVRVLAMAESSLEMA